MHQLVAPDALAERVEKNVDGRDEARRDWGAQYRSGRATGSAPAPDQRLGIYALDNICGARYSARIDNVN
jgi:hypothetical protein